MLSIIHRTYCDGVSIFIPSAKIGPSQIPVNRLQGCAAGAAHAGDSDDARAPLQVRQTLSRNEKNSLQVRVALLIPVLERRLREGDVGRIDACTIEYMVQSAKLLQDGGHKRLHI